MYIGYIGNIICQQADQFVSLESESGAKNLSEIYAFYKHSASKYIYKAEK